MILPSWEKIVEAKENASDKKIKPDPFRELCYLTFEKNPSGKKLLNYLIEDRILNKSFQLDISDRIVFMELGKQELIKSIRKAIKVYKHQEEK